MSRKFLTGIDANNQKITSVADPTNPSDAVTKNYADALANGVSFKQAVLAATTTNITLSGAQTIDGVTVPVGSRVLVKDQSTASQNGLYTVAAGAWTRTLDANSSLTVVAGSSVFVTGGTVNGDKQFVLITDGTITPGTTPQSWTTSAAGGSSYTAGNGILVSGTVISAVPSPGGGLIVSGTGISVDPSASFAVKRFAQDIPASASNVITHGLATLDVLVQVTTVATGELVDTDIVKTSANAVTVSFATAPTAGQYRVTIVG